VGTSTQYFIFCYHIILPDKKTLRFTEGNQSQFTIQRWRQIQGLLIIVFYAKLRSRSSATILIIQFTLYTDVLYSIK